MQRVRVRVSRDMYNVCVSVRIGACAMGSACVYWGMCNGCVRVCIGARAMSVCVV